MKVANTLRVPGYFVRELQFTVPLNQGFVRWTNADFASKLPETITLAAREVTKLPAVPLREAPKPKPYLVYLQGGPGFAAPSVADDALPAYVRRAAKDYTVLLLDQRGTGLSTPIIGEHFDGVDPTMAADYLANFRADSIVADCECIRKAMSVDRWSLLGQSWGGFIITRYLSVARSSLHEVFFTGGIPITNAPATAATTTDGAAKSCLADHLYRALFKRVITRNERFYRRYPADTPLIHDIVQVLRESGGVPLPRGGVLTVERFRAFGINFGFAGGFDNLHNLVATAFLPRLDGTVDRKTLSPVFLRKFEATESWDSAPIYVLLHESIYCSGGAASYWAADRVMRTEFPQFLQESRTNPFLFTGEMVFPWLLRDCVSLKPLAAAGELLAARSWPDLYTPPAAESVPATHVDEWGMDTVRGAAIVYEDDMFVERTFSEQTAREQLGLGPDFPMWITNEFDHGGLRSNGEAIVEKLFAMAAGEVHPR
jgi:pimeloyl-ACP methyl ester carboxylesterase